jgi:tRNA (guanosine-2'-O-)-methyltransferase
VDQAADAVAAAGYRLVGIELAQGATPLHELDLPADVCLALGHEDRGLSKACLARCDDLAYVPLLGSIASLNVATAAAVAIYEVRRRAWTR